MKKTTNYTSYEKKHYLAYTSNNASYKIGNYTFKNKTDITKCIRTMLTQLEHNVIIEDENIISFIKDLIKLHPTKNHYNILNVMVKLHKEEEYHTEYSNFFIEYENGIWDNFSTNKCIANIKGNKKTIKTKTDFFEYDMFMFGKYKGNKIDEVINKDKSYIEWFIVNFKPTEEQKDFYNYVVKKYESIE